MKVRMTVGRLALGLLVGSVLAAPSVVQAQTPWPGPQARWPLQPSSGIDRIVAPFLEGWYDNGDGTITYSFGYNSLNEETVEIPLGENNRITPSQYDGMQPTSFLPGKHRGMFAVTVPANRTEDVWWTIVNPNGEVTRIPGRHTWNAYQLDHNPRPHGTVPPVVQFGNQTAQGVVGLVSPQTVTATVGQPVVLEVTARDVSERDMSDPRFREPTSLRVVWTKQQGPVGGEVTFTRHESTEVREQRGRRGGDGGGGGAPQAGERSRAPGAEEVMLYNGNGTARVYATFSMPGEYLMNGQVDNWRAPDSNSGDQCCWTNAYVRVTVR